ISHGPTANAKTGNSKRARGGSPETLKALEIIEWLVAAPAGVNCFARSRPELTFLLSIHRPTVRTLDSSARPPDRYQLLSRSTCTCSARRSDPVVLELLLCCSG